MVSSEFTEVEIVQNSALAAVMIWQCGLGFQKEAEGLSMQIPVAFFVLPVCLHQGTLNKLLSTQRRSGLSLFAAKVAENRENLLALHERALLYRELTLASIGVGIQSKLLSIDYAEARVRCNTQRMPSERPEKVKSLIRGAERFGAWCGRLSVDQIATILRIDL